MLQKCVLDLASGVPIDWTDKIKRIPVAPRVLFEPSLRIISDPNLKQFIVIATE